MAIGLLVVPRVEGVCGVGAPEEGIVFPANLAPQLHRHTLAARFLPDGKFGEIVSGVMLFEQHRAAILLFNIGMGNIFQKRLIGQLFAKARFK